MYVVFYLVGLFTSVHGASYQLTESAWIERAQQRIPRLNNLPTEIQMNDEEPESFDCRYIGKRILSGLAFLFCCTKKEGDDGLYMRCEENLSLQEAVSNGVQNRERIDVVQGLLNKELLDSLMSSACDVEAVERAVLGGADPWGQVSNEFGQSVSPLLYAVNALNTDDVRVRERSNQIYTMLNAYRLKEEHIMHDVHYEQKCEKVLQMHRAVKYVMGEFGQRQDVQAFEQYGPLWGEICRLLGIDMTVLRAGVFPLMKKKDLSESDDYMIRKTLQTQFGPFERFALACAVHDFVYCLASTIATSKVYEINSFCDMGIIIKASSSRVSVCKIDAERVRMLLNQEARARLSCMISILTMRVGM